MNVYTLLGHLLFQSVMHSPLLCSFCSISLAPHTPPPSAAWVMACVAFLSLWEVVLHGLPLSSCFHACPFNRLGNPSWYLYRPRFSWYRCSPSSSPPSLLQSLSLSPALFSPISCTSPLCLSPLLIMCSSAQVSIYTPNSSCHHISPPWKSKQLWNCQNTSELRSVMARNKFCMVKQRERRELLSSLTEGWLVYRYEVNTSGRGANWFVV